MVTGQPAQIADIARDVLAGGAFGQGAAHEDVFDFAGIDAGAGDGVLDGVAAHHRAMGHVEAAAHGFGETGARGRNDDGFSHGKSPMAELEKPSPQQRPDSQI